MPSARFTTSSLRQRALMWLAQREHSRKELHDKLLRWLRAVQTVQAVQAVQTAQTAQTAQDLRPPASAAPSTPATPSTLQPEHWHPPHALQQPDPPAPPDLPRTLQLSETPDAQHISALLDELEAAGHLSDARLVESRIHVRASRFGNLRIERELRQLGVAADEAALAALRDSELPRAQAVWSRKFGQPPANAAERGKQMRFLAARGFSADTVRAVLRGAGGEEVEDDRPGPGEGEGEGESG